MKKYIYVCQDNYSKQIYMVVSDENIFENKSVRATMIKKDILSGKEVTCYEDIEEFLLELQKVSTWFGYGKDIQYGLYRKFFDQLVWRHEDLKELPGMPDTVEEFKEKLEEASSELDWSDFF